jgi:hypothetical protein
MPITSPYSFSRSFEQRPTEFHLLPEISQVKVVGSGTMTVTVIALTWEISQF